MKFIKKYLSLIAIFGCYDVSNAQMAYDGNGDYKIFVGYINVDGKSGIDFQFDSALTELVSVGVRLNYLIKPGNDNSNEENYGKVFTKVDNILQNYNAGIFVRFHFGPTFKIAETMDPFLGLDASVKSLGAHAGFKYKLSDVIGLNAMYNYSFSSSFAGDTDLENESFINYYGKSNAVSVGVTFNIDY